MMTYKRGIEKYSFYLSDGTRCDEAQKVYHVYQSVAKIGFISKTIDTWHFYKNIDSDYLCGGLTLKEAKESLSKCLTAEHWNAKEVQEYFNN